MAVGRPRERLPPLGARLYVRDDWQRVVADMAAAADLVVFRIGRTPGFWWELHHVVASCDPRRVLIYLPKKDRKRAYAAFRGRAEAVLPHPLPLYPREAEFLGFNADWSPRLLGTARASASAGWRWWLGSGNAPVVREALDEALRPLGLDARPLPMQPREWVRLYIYVVLVFQCCWGILLRP